MTTPNEYRLALTLRPIHYTFYIKTDIEKLTFSGHVIIECVRLLYHQRYSLQLIEMVDLMCWMRHPRRFSHFEPEDILHLSVGFTSAQQGHAVSSVPRCALFFPLSIASHIFDI